MSKAYDKFKDDTIDASQVIERAKNMRALNDDFADGFRKAMWEAREIFLRLEDEFNIEPVLTGENKLDEQL